MRRGRCLRTKTLCRKSSLGNLEEEAKESKKWAAKKNQATVQENKDVVLLMMEVMCVLRC